MDIENTPANVQTAVEALRSKQADLMRQIREEANSSSPDVHACDVMHGRIATLEDAEAILLGEDDLG